MFTHLSRDERQEIGSDRPTDAQTTYEIRIRGRLTDSYLQAFDGMSASVHSVETVLHGPLADQAELHEVLDRVQALGLELIDVREVPAEPVAADDTA